MPSNSTEREPGSPFGLDDRHVNRAWERHLSGGLPDRAVVRSMIHQSWMRSTSAGVDPLAAEAPTVDDAGEVERLYHANRELCLAARGALDKIGRMLQGADAMLMLTDEKGMVIEALGDPQTIAAGRKINLQVGAQWHEGAVGTNGIGTALFTGEPVFVHGSEHYVETIKDWSCAAAPIRHPLDQSVIGAVDLSGLTKIFRQHNTAFAAAAAGEIEAVLLQAMSEERIRLMEALLEQVPRIGQDDGILILDRMGRILQRSGLQRLILSNGMELDTRTGQRFVHLSAEASSDDVVKALPKNLDYREVSSLAINGEVRGFALVLDCRRSTRRVACPAIIPPRPVPGSEFVTGCPHMLESIDLARRVARVNAPVLVQGETGTGKELFARLIHAEKAGNRVTPFIAINCGAISRELFGGELFGHVEGAFTGAARQGKPGKLELANGGVFCLDEVGEMPLEIQPYLLRVLEERVSYRIGDNRPRPFDAQLVALTNRDLRVEAEANRFRLDLYYRIGAVTVHVPPLRERGQDVLLLLEHFNFKVAGEFGLDPLRFPPELTDLFLRYHWPGNVRELRNLVQRLHSLSRHRDIALCDLPPEIRVEPRPRPPSASALPGSPALAPWPPDAWAGKADASVGPVAPSLPRGGTTAKLKEVEKAAILDAIATHHGNLTQVAKALGVTRATLYRKLQLYKIERVFR